MKNKIIFLICYLGFINSSCAIIFGDIDDLKKAQKDTINSGACRLIIKSENQEDIRIRQANASLLKTNENKTFVVAAPLNYSDSYVETLRNLKSFSQNQKYSSINIKTVNQPSVAKSHSLYSAQKFYYPKFYQDIYLKECHACFLEQFENHNDFVSQELFFTSGVYQKPLEHQREYSVNIRSFGSSFDRQLKLYKDGCYHETQMVITYDKDDDSFWKKSVSRSFYLKFIPYEKENYYRWFCGLLPASSDIVMDEEDSGALIITQDNQAIAVVGNVDCQNFYDQNEAFYDELLKFKGFDKDHAIRRDCLIHKDYIKLFIEFIKSKMAQSNQTQHLKFETQSFIDNFTFFETQSSVEDFTLLQAQPSVDGFILSGSQSHLYGFTLKDGMKDLTLIEHYVSLQDRISLRILSRL